VEEVSLAWMPKEAYKDVFTATSVTNTGQSMRYLFSYPELRLLNHERSLIWKMEHDGVLETAEAQLMIDNIEAQMLKIRTEDTQYELR
jgi:hypothetical protein